MNPDMTISDFILEVDAFHYSKENFHLLKEMGEINLLDIFLHNHKFGESGQLAEEQLISLKEMTNGAEGFEFTEAVYMEMESTLAQKVKSAITKILSLLVKPFQFIYSALRWIVDRAGKWLQLKLVIETELKKLQELMKDTENAERLHKAYPKLIQQFENRGPAAVGGQHSLAYKLHEELDDLIRKLTGGQTIDYELWNRVGVTLLRPEVSVPSFIADIDTIANQFVNVLQDIGTGDLSQLSDEAAQKHVDALEAMAAEVRQGITTEAVTIDPLKMKALVRQLEAVNKTIQQTVDKVVAASTEHLPANQPVDAASVATGIAQGKIKMVNAFKTVSLEFQKVSTQSIKHLQYYIKTRESYISRFHALLIALQKAAKGEQYAVESAEESSETKKASKATVSIFGKKVEVSVKFTKVDDDEKQEKMNKILEDFEKMDIGDDVKKDVARFFYILYDAVGERSHSEKDIADDIWKHITSIDRVYVSHGAGGEADQETIVLVGETKADPEHGFGMGWKHTKFTGTASQDLFF